jgi:hypothetical protein
MKMMRITQRIICKVLSKMARQVPRLFGLRWMAAGDRRKSATRFKHTADTGGTRHRNFTVRVDLLCDVLERYKIKAVSRQCMNCRLRK